jgi:hypothetical protein
MRPARSPAPTALCASLVARLAQSAALERRSGRSAEEHPAGAAGIQGHEQIEPRLGAALAADERPGTCGGLPVNPGQGIAALVAAQLVKLLSDPRRAPCLDPAGAAARAASSPLGHAGGDAHGA